jgi:hypothetical protein
VGFDNIDKKFRPKQEPDFWNKPKQQAPQVQSKRQQMIEAYIASCTECGRRDFPKRSDCDGCIAAVDEDSARQRECETCFGSGWRNYGIGNGPHYESCPACSNPMELPSP